MSGNCDVAIVGAGPYGLATAAHLKAGNGLRTQVFGEPMSFWREMPKGMLLRSPYDACNIGAPAGMTLDDWRVQHGLPLEIPVPLDRFLEYGDWFQQRVAPDVDRRRVARVEAAGSGYRLTLSDGDELTAKRVVVAAGIGDFPNRPDVFRELPPELASHTADEADLHRFAGKRVLMVGAGQSALEGAALLHEAGVDQLEVLVRERSVRWLSLRVHHELGAVSKLLYAWPDVGPAGVSHLVARPDAYRRLPRKLQDRLSPRCIRAAGAGWLVPRMAGIVSITTGVHVVEALAQDGTVRLRLSDGSTREADHLLLGTGYKVDVARYPFLAESLLERVRRVNGHPVVSGGFESSSAGLHFVGAPAAWSWGPLMRFVAGSDFAARRASAAIRAAV